MNFRALSLLSLWLFLLTFGVGMARAQSESTFDPLAMDAAFGNLKVRDGSGSPLRAAREDWERARMLVRQVQEWGIWLRGHRERLDAWMSSGGDRAEYVAGYGFKLLDPVTKAPVQWSVRMPIPAGGTGAAEDARRAWISWNRLHNISNVLEAARMCRLVEERKYCDWALAQLDFYAANYEKWPLQTWNGRARMMSQSLDEATSTVALVEALRLLGAQVDPAHRKSLYERLFHPIVKNLADFDQGINNIAVWHAAAMAAVALEFGDEALLARALSDKRGINALLAAGVTRDYLWHEGSFAYNNYVISALVPLFVQASLKGRVSMLRPAMLLAQNMMLAPLQFRFADGYLPVVADSRARTKAVDLGIHLMAARVFPTVIGLIEARRVKSWETLLDPLDVIPGGASSLPSVQTRHFEASRMAVLKNSSWQVFVHYGQLTHAHAQAEVPSYELFGEGGAVSLDPGTVDYGSPWHEQYFRRAIAHNVVLVDGKGQDTWQRNRFEQFSEAPPEILVNAPSYQQGVSLSRGQRLADRVFQDRVVVSLESSWAAPRRIGLLFHTTCDVRLEESVSRQLQTSPPPQGEGFSYWTGIRSATMPRAWQAVLACDQIEYRMEFDAAQAHRLYIASAPATPLPSRRTVIYTELVSRQAEFETRIHARGGK